MADQFYFFLRNESDFFHELSTLLTHLQFKIISIEARVTALIGTYPLRMRSFLHLIHFFISPPCFIKNSPDLESGLFFMY